MRGMKKYLKQRNKKELLASSVGSTKKSFGIMVSFVQTLKSFLFNLRFHTTFRLHMLYHHLNWYKKWHKWRLHHHVHVAVLVVYVTTLILGSLGAFVGMPPGKARASSDFSWDMNNPVEYTYDNSKIEVNGGEAKLQGSYTPGVNWIATDTDSGTNYNWRYRKSIAISNPNGTSDFQVQLTGVDTVLSGKVQANCSDLKFTASDGVTVMPHWIESTTCPSASTTIWVKVPMGQTTVYMYYGNSKSEWTARDSNRNWWLVTSSSDGTKLAAVDNGGQIYTSTNSGATWTPRDYNRAWNSITSSSDGTKLVATVWGGQIYTSESPFTTWTPRDSNRNWTNVASSSDGTKLVATVWGGQIYTSTNSGATWTPRDSNRNWWGIASSSDGTKLVAGVQGSGQIYTSTDSGATWTPRGSIGSWNSVTSSSDGTKLAAANNGGQIYTSTDSGVTWTARASSRTWRAIASSANGTKLAATNNGGQIYISTDSGATWNASDSSRNWWGIAMSADGTKLAATNNGGQIYTSTTTNSDVNTFEKVISNVQGAWMMDSNMNDSSGNSYNGHNPGDSENPPNGCLDFSKTYFNQDVGDFGYDSYCDDNQYIQVDDASAPKLNMTNNFSFSAWVKTTSDTDNQTIFKKGLSSGDVNSTLYLIPGNKLEFSWRIGGVWHVHDSTVGFAANSWHHIAVTFSRPALTYYIDGVEAGTFSDNANLGTSNSNAVIGYDNEWANSFLGYIDELKIYDTSVLTQSEVTALADSTNKNHYSYFSPTLHPNIEYLREYSATTPAGAIGAETTLYPIDSPSITSDISHKYNVITAFTEVLGSGSSGAIKYVISNDNGVRWYGWYGGGWCIIGTIDCSNNSASITASNLNTYIASFTGTYGPGPGTHDFKWRAFFNSDGSQQPKLDQVNITIADTLPPDNVSSVNGFSDDSQTTPMGSNVWHNYPMPSFSWSKPTDYADTANGETPSGIDNGGGYYTYWGTENNGDPSGDPIGGAFISDGSTQFSSLDQWGYPALVSGQTYYLRMRTLDSEWAAGTCPDYDGGQRGGGWPNCSSLNTLFTYKYDATLPVNPPNLTRTPYAPTDVQNNFRFDWSGATDTDPDGAGPLEASGVQKYQWRTANEDPVTGWHDTTDTFVTGVSAYQLGENWFYVRTVDNAGNTADSYSQIRYLWSGNAPPAPPQLQVYQNNPSTNRQIFRWKAPTHDEAIQEYRYAVNVGELNANNSHTVNPTPDGEGWVYTPEISAGTQQGTNTFRVVAVDALNQVNYTYYSEVEFNVSTPGPGFPTAPVISDISNMDTGKWALALSWDAPTSGPSVDHYVIQRTATPNNEGSWADLSTTSSTVYADSYQLNNTTQYSYRVLSVDNASKRSTASNEVERMPTGKYSAKPKVVTGPSASTTATSATITWSTEREATSFVKYGVGGFGSSVGSNTLATTHTVTLSGLNPGTVYTYKVQSFDEQREYNINDESSWSSAITFTTQAAPGISEVKISDIRLDSAIVTWKTTSSATSTVKYGKTNSYGKELSDSSGSAVTTHTVKISSLDDSSTYHFKIFGTDTDGNQMMSDDYSLETLTFPKISNVKYDQVRGTATSTMRVKWDSNVPVSSTVEYSDASGKVREASQSQLVTKHEILVSGLKDNNEYTMTVRGRDAYGNEGVSDTQKVKTDYDTRPPEISEITTETAITGYGANAKSQVIASWNTDEPSTSQVEYNQGVSGNSYSMSTQEDTTLTTSHVVVMTDLNPSNSYYFRVVSRDASKNEAKSDANSVLTDQTRFSIFDIVLKSFEDTLGWLFGMKG